MKLKTTLLVALMTAAVNAAPSKAQAQDHGLYYAQSSALLTYADAEIRLLYASVTAKEFDPALTKSLVKELERTMSEAKRKLDRVSTLMPEKYKKQEPAIQKVRDKMIKVENQLQRLATDIEEQTKGLGEEEEEEDEEPVTRDWTLLKNGAGWLAQDLKAAKSGFAKLARKLGVRPLPSPKRPRGKRPE